MRGRRPCAYEDLHLLLVSHDDVLRAEDQRKKQRLKLDNQEKNKEDDGEGGNTQCQSVHQLNFQLLKKRQTMLRNLTPGSPAVRPRVAGSSLPAARLAGSPVACPAAGSPASTSSSSSDPLLLRVARGEGKWLSLLSSALGDLGSSHFLPSCRC